jgi:hypothetical protein
MFGGKEITLQPGQLITGRKELSNKCNSNESKIERILKSLENEQQIEQQKSNKNRVITIVNWHRYQKSEQQNEQQVNNNRTTSEHKQEYNKNIYKNIYNNTRTREDALTSTKTLSGKDGVDDCPFSTGTSRYDF